MDVRLARLVLLAVLLLAGMIACSGTLPTDNASISPGVNYTVINPYAGGVPFKAQLHAHTSKSDGVLKPEEVVKLYESAGYSLLALTDHNRVTKVQDLSGISMLSGIELASETAHLVGLDVVSVPHLLNRTVQGVIDAIDGAGGMCDIAHPAARKWKVSDNELDSLSGYRFMEVYNGGTGDAEERWEYALERGSKVWAIAVDDMHRPADFNKAWVTVFAPDKATGSLVQALKAGNFYASDGPTLEISSHGNVLEIATPGTAVITWKTAAGRSQVDTWKTSATFTVGGDEGYVRAVVERVNDKKKAWTQPVYIMRQNN